MLNKGVIWNYKWLADRGCVCCCGRLQVGPRCGRVPDGRTAVGVCFLAFGAPRLKGRGSVRAVEGGGGKASKSIIGYVVSAGRKECAMGV